MVVNNPNNWHWVEKNTLPWAQEYLSEQLQQVKYSTSTHDIIVKSASVNGDCDVSQRKGKVICIYDLGLDLGLEGIAKEEEVEGFTGKIKINEFIHDEKDFEISLNEFGDNKALVKNELLPLILQVLYKFQDALIEAHSKDLQE